MELSRADETAVVETLLKRMPEQCVVGTPCSRAVRNVEQLARSVLSGVIDIQDAYTLSQESAEDCGVVCDTEEGFDGDPGPGWGSLH